MAKKPPNIFEETPGSPRWNEALRGLSAQDQDAIINLQFGNNPTAQLPNSLDTFDDTGFDDQGAPFTFGGATNFGAGDFGTGGLDASMDPAYLQVLQSGGGVNIPQLTSSGKLDPYDLGQEQARTNLMQDQWTSLADVVGASMSGPGAIDPSLFAPTKTMPTEKLKTPGITRAQQYAAGGGYESYIAQKMLGDETHPPVSDAEAVADMWDFANKSPEEIALLPPAQQKQHADLVRSLPQNPQSPGFQLPSETGAGASNRMAAAAGTAGASRENDLLRVNNFASDLFKDVSVDLAARNAGWENPDKPGEWFTEAPTEEPSYLTTKFHNLGLPTPIAQYDDPEFLKQMEDQYAPTRLADEAAKTANVSDLQAQQDALLAKARQLSANDIDVQDALRDVYTPPGYATPDVRGAQASAETNASLLPQPPSTATPSMGRSTAMPQALLSRLLNQGNGNGPPTFPAAGTQVQPVMPPGAGPRRTTPPGLPQIPSAGTYNPYQDPTVATALGGGGGGGRRGPAVPTGVPNIPSAGTYNPYQDPMTATMVGPGGGAGRRGPAVPTGVPNIPNAGVYNPYQDPTVAAMVGAGGGGGGGGGGGPAVPPGLPQIPDVGTYDPYQDPMVTALLAQQNPPTPSAGSARPTAGQQADVKNIQNNAALTNMASQYTPGQMNPNITKYTFGNPETGYQLAGSGGQAMAMDAAYKLSHLFDAGKKTPRVEKLTPQTAARSKEMSRKASDEFEKANIARFRAKQTSPQSRLDMITAGEQAQFAAANKRTPFLDAMLQRLLGQRSVGVRGI